MKQSLRENSFRKHRQKGDFNPIEGVVNITDVMLVFACGLMLAVIMNWNVDIGFKAEQVDLSVSKEVTSEGTKPGDHSNESLDPEKGYEKMGVLYKDPATGKIYMLTEE